MYLYQEVDFLYALANFSITSKPFYKDCIWETASSSVEEKLAYDLDCLDKLA